MNLNRIITLLAAAQLEKTERAHHLDEEKSEKLKPMNLNSLEYSEDLCYPKPNGNLGLFHELFWHRKSVMSASKSETLPGTCIIGVG